MRLFLTSNSFSSASKKVYAEFWKLVSKKPDDVRLAFIPTASYFEKNKSYVERDRKLLQQMGILEKNTVDVKLNKPITIEDLKTFDVIFVEGGNSFYLLQKARESGFDKAIREYLEKDFGVYVGVSAGTILAGPNIVIARPYDDESKAHLKNTKGLALTPSVFLPHFQNKDTSVHEEYQSKASYPIKPLRDGEAVISDGTNEKIIS